MWQCGSVAVWQCGSVVWRQQPQTPTAWDAVNGVSVRPWVSRLFAPKSGVDQGSSCRTDTWVARKNFTGASSRKNCMEFLRWGPFD